MNEVNPSAAARTPRQRSFGRGVLRRLGVDLRPGEGLPAALFFLFFFLVITFQYATKSVRQSTFIDSLGAARLPWAYLAVALVSYPVLRLYSIGVGRIRRHHLVALTTLVVGATMVLFRGLFSLDAAWVPVVFYVWISIVYVMLPSQFWSFATQVYEPRQARRLFGLIGAGGLLGGIAGGQVARWGTALVGTRNSLLLAALLLLGVAVVAFWIQRRHPAEGDVEGRAAAPDAGAARAGGAELKRSPLLRSLAIVLTLTVIVAQIVDLQFSWAVEQATTSLDERTAFFGNFYSIMGIAAFLFQLLFTARIHRSLGVGVGLAVLPLTMAFGTGLLVVAAIAAPSLLLLGAGILKVGENGLRYSLDQASRELLYMPVPAQARLKAKAFIDVFVQRGAKGLAALLLLPVALAVITPLQAGWLTLALVVIWLAVLTRLRRAYVGEFRRGLRERRPLEPLPLDLSDATTLELLVESLSSPNDRQVVHAIHLLIDHGRSALVSPLLLHHESAEVRRLTLEALAASGRREQLPHVERVLGDPEPQVREAAVAALARLARGDLGELMRPHLEEADPAVRATAIAALASGWEMDPLVRTALEELLTDGSPGARREGARALAELPEPEGREQLMRLAGDDDPEVAAAGIGAIRERLERDGYQPVYLPLLVARLNDRHVKHEAREALVACGSSAVAALTHFLREPGESIWVRRALPRTIARLPGAEVPRILAETLRGERDQMLRGKLIAALGELATPRTGEVRALLTAEIEAEAGTCVQAMADLHGLGFSGRGRWRGPVPEWDDAAPPPSLLERLLEERHAGSLHHLFGLLALLLDPGPMWSSWQSLTRGDRHQRQMALEFLDNELTEPSRTAVDLVVGDAPLETRLNEAVRSLGVRVGDREAVLRRLLATASGGSEDDRDLAEAALYSVRTEQLVGLLPAVEDLAQVEDPILRETATWVLARLAGTSGSARIEGGP